MFSLISFFKQVLIRLQNYKLHVHRM